MPGASKANTTARDIYNAYSTPQRTLPLEALLVDIINYLRNQSFYLMPAAVAFVEAYRLALLQSGQLAYAVEYREDEANPMQVAVNAIFAHAETYRRSVIENGAADAAETIYGVPHVLGTQTALLQQLKQSLPVIESEGVVDRVYTEQEREFQHVGRDQVSENITKLVKAVEQAREAAIQKAKSDKKKLANLLQAIQAERQAKGFAVSTAPTKEHQTKEQKEKARLEAAKLTEEELAALEQRLFELLHYCEHNIKVGGSVAEAFRLLIQTVKPGNTTISKQKTSKLDVQGIISYLNEKTSNPKNFQPLHAVKAMVPTIQAILNVRITPPTKCDGIFVSATIQQMVSRAAVALNFTAMDYQEGQSALSLPAADVSKATTSPILDSEGQTQWSTAYKYDHEDPLQATLPISLGEFMLRHAHRGLTQSGETAYDRSFMGLFAQWHLAIRAVLIGLGLSEYPIYPQHWQSISQKLYQHYQAYERSVLSGQKQVGADVCYSIAQIIEGKGLEGVMPDLLQWLFEHSVKQPLPIARKLSMSEMAHRPDQQAFEGLWQYIVDNFHLNLCETTESIIQHKAELKDAMHDQQFLICALYKLLGGKEKDLKKFQELRGSGVTVLKANLTAEKTKSPDGVAAKVLQVLDTYFQPQAPLQFDNRYADGEYLPTIIRMACSKWLPSKIDVEKFKEVKKRRVMADYKKHCQVISKQQQEHHDQLKLVKSACSALVTDQSGMLSSLRKKLMDCLSVFSSKIMDQLMFATEADPTGDGGHKDAWGLYDTLQRVSDLHTSILVKTIDLGKQIQLMAPVDHPEFSARELIKTAQSIVMNMQHLLFIIQAMLNKMNKALPSSYKIEQGMTEAYNKWRNKFSEARQELQDFVAKCNDTSLASNDLKNLIDLIQRLDPHAACQCLDGAFQKHKSTVAGWDDLDEPPHEFWQQIEGGSTVDAEGNPQHTGWGKELGEKVETIKGFLHANSTWYQKTYGSVPETTGGARVRVTSAFRHTHRKRTVTGDGATKKSTYGAGAPYCN